MTYYSALLLSCVRSSRRLVAECACTVLKVAEGAFKTHVNRAFFKGAEDGRGSLF